MTECSICLEEGYLIRPCSKCTVETHEHCWCIARSLSDQCPMCRQDLEVINRPNDAPQEPDTNRVTLWMRDHPLVLNMIYLGMGLVIVTGIGFVSVSI
jgi:hypothetical protein